MVFNSAFKGLSMPRLEDKVLRE